jgi:hypothetical protein
MPTDPKLLVSPSTVRRTLEEAYAAHGTPTGTGVFDRWYQSRINDLKSQGLLVTEQQERDIYHHRKLQAGDAARYVGPDRVEDGVPRPAGQLGYVSAAGTRDGDPITFEPEDENAPALIVAVGTYSYWLLERVPDRQPPTDLAKDHQRALAGTGGAP